jgi:translation initiation factor IF-3
MNERIRAREIRVIGDEGEQIGVMPPFEALKMARERNLDLVEISPTAQPPVCRIMDYGKFLYQNEKRFVSTWTITTTKPKRITYCASSTRATR